MPKALVVDDAKVTRILLARYLRELGFETCEAADGQAGLALLDAERDVALVLVDWKMPNLDGLEFLKRLRSDPARTTVPAVMVTCETDTDQILLALQAGASEYIMKPFTKEMLEDKLRLVGLLP